MIKQKEYRVEEIFRYEAETFQCVLTDPSEGVHCLNCEACNQICATLICLEKERSDKKKVHFVRVTEPKAGMLFRASDGVLYELKEFGGGKCICNRGENPDCQDVHKQAFCKLLPAEFGWYPVEEKKVEE